MGYKYTDQIVSLQDIRDIETAALTAQDEASEARKMATLGWAYFAVITIPLGAVGIAVTAISTAEALVACFDDDAEQICNNFLSTVKKVREYMVDNGIEYISVSVCTKSCTHPGTSEELWYPYSMYVKGMPR